MGICPDRDGYFRLGAYFLQNSIDEFRAPCLLYELFRHWKLKIEFLGEGIALNHSRFLAYATPLDFNPNLWVTFWCNCVKYVKFCYINDKIAKTFFQGYVVPALFEFWLRGQANQTLDCSTLELFLTVEFVFMNLQLDLKLTVKNTLQTNTSWNCELLQPQLTVHKSNL